MIAAVIGAGPRRTSPVAAGSLAANAAYAAWNLALGVGGASAWLVTMGCYYAVLAVVRFCCVFRGLVRDSAESERLERAVGGVLAALAMVLSGMVVLTVHGGVDAGGNQIVVISQATYTFLAFAQAIHAFARRRGGEPDSSCRQGREGRAVGGLMAQRNSRYSETAELMDEAFLDLLGEKDLEFVTAKDVCSRAGVSRSTFYLHYESIAELIEESVRLVFSRFRDHFGASREQVTFERLAAAPAEDLYMVTSEYLGPYLEFVRLAGIHAWSPCSFPE